MFNMSTSLQRVRDRHLANILSTIDVSVIGRFTVDTINWSRWPKQWLFIRWCKINFMTQITWTIHWCHLRVFQGDREVLIRFQKAKKWPFCSMFSLLTFTCLDQQENQQQRGMLLSKKNVHAILKEQRSTHIPLATNLHF